MAGVSVETRRDCRVAARCVGVKTLESEWAAEPHCNTPFPEYVLNCVFSFSIVFFDLLSVFDRF